MKLYRNIFLSLMLSGICFPAYCWDREGHAAICQIAENHLTKKTAAAVKEYMRGESTVTFSSYPDDYKDRLNNTLKQDLEWSRDLERGFAHTYEVDENLQGYHTFYDKDGRHITNGVLMTECFINDLKDKDLVDSLKFIELVMLCHFVGDLHCPTHVRYQPKRNIASWKISFRGSDISYHSFWDGALLRAYYPWSSSDLAKICDICSEKEIAEIIKGDVFDWASETATVSLPVRNTVQAGDTITHEWCLDRLELARVQIRKGGYRLAHTLNMIFDPAYARKHNR